MTEVIGAIAGTQKYFLFFFPYVYETSLLIYIISEKEEILNLNCMEKNGCSQCTLQAEEKPGK